MTSAISSTWAGWPSSVVVPSCLMSSGFAPSLRTGPRATVLTRTPARLNSAAHALLSAVNDAYVAPWAAPPARPTYRPCCQC